jgi:Zn-dependent peptidase ImmA (M78 family)
MPKENDFLSEFDVEELNDLASSIADYYFPNGQIDPILIAERNNISYSFGNYSDAFDGLIECEDAKFHIFMNLNRLQHSYSERARFTFAHELGHYFIDSHRNSLLKGLSPSHCSQTGFKSRNRAERQADYFASCLLMPENSFKKYCYRKKFEYRIIEELSKKFGTSKSATALRFCAIGNHPIMVVYSYKNSIRWFWSSQDFRFRWLRNGKDKLPDDTVAGEYFNLGRKSIKTEPVFAMDWFDIKYNYQANLPFKEHCLIYDDHCLSIIWEE